MDALDALYRIRRPHPYELDDVHLGNSEAVIGDPNDHRGDDGQGERKAQQNGGAKAHLAVQLHMAAQLLGVGAHHIHAHAATRNIRYGFGSGETRHEDQVDDLAIRHFVGLRLGHQSLGQCLLEHLLGIDAGTIIGDGDVHLAAFVVRVQEDLPRGPLLGLAALFRRLEGVVRAVADDVREGIHQQLDDALVQLDLGPLDLDLDLLSKLPGHVPDDAREATEHGADGLHASLHDPFLQLRRDLIDVLQDSREPWN